MTLEKKILAPLRIHVELEHLKSLSDCAFTDEARTFMHVRMHGVWGGVVPSGLFHMSNMERWQLQLSCTTQTTVLICKGRLFIRNLDEPNQQWSCLPPHCWEWRRVYMIFTDSFVTSDNQSAAKVMSRQTNYSSNHECKPRSLLMTHTTFCLKRSQNKMKLNELGRQKIRKAEWPSAGKAGKSYNLTNSRLKQKEPLIVLDYQQTRP